MVTVSIACNIPGGLLLGTTGGPGTGLPTNPVVLNGPPACGGTNSAAPGFGFTEVDETFWTSWLAAYGNGPIITAGAVWQA
jgi:hypothetical protein